MTRVGTHYWIILAVLLVAAWGSRSTADPVVSTVSSVRRIAPRPLDPAVAECQAIWERAQAKTSARTAEAAAQPERTHLDRPSELFTRGRTNAPEVALTFDDGPHAGFTPRLLAVLKREGVPATFFVVGKMVVRYPDLARAIAADGHTLANHSFRHANLERARPDDLLTEWQACQDAVETITGKRMKFCRPPGGDYNGEVVAAAQKLGLLTVLWTQNSHDYLSPGAAEIKSRVLEHVANGSIILMHDGVDQTIEVLPEIIRDLKQRGFHFVTVDELWQHSQRPEPRGSHNVQPASRRPTPRAGVRVAVVESPTTPAARVPHAAAPASH